MTKYKTYIFVAFFLLFCFAIKSAYALEYITDKSKADSTTIEKEEANAKEIFKQLQQNFNLRASGEEEFIKIIALQNLTKYRWMQGVKFNNDTVDKIYYLNTLLKEKKQEIEKIKTISRYLGSNVASLNVDLWVSRAKTVYGSTDAKYWNIPYLDYKDQYFEHRF
ncbi:MAG: hypothetical protein ACOYK8_04530 [Alphaproteobacteria bacterium]